MMTQTQVGAITTPDASLSSVKETDIFRGVLPRNTNILFLVDQLTELGGGERALFQLARELTENGIAVFVITFRDYPNPEAFQLFNAITILPFSSCFSARAFRVAWQLYRYIRRHNVNLVQSFFESADTFGSLVAWLSGVSCIISSRRDMGFLRSAKHRLAYRAMSHIYSRVICVSEKVEQWHRREDHLRKGQALTINNGTDLRRYADKSQSDNFRRKHSIPLDVPIIVTIANVNPWKGIDIFIECAAVVHHIYPAAVFVVAGEWTDILLVQTLHERATQLGIADSVYFLGRVEDIPALLLTSRVFVLLSRSEGFPNVVIEAMAAGLPVVATAVGGTPEAVDNGVTGFLVENEDSAGAATHINRLLADPDLRCRVGNSGRQRVQERFSIQQMVRKHVEVYDAILRNRR